MWVHVAALTEAMRVWRWTGDAQRALDQIRDRRGYITHEAELLKCLTKQKTLSFMLALRSVGYYF